MQVKPIIDDQILLEALRYGDERALGKLYDRYRLRLISIAMNRLDNEKEAEKCVQDVFISMWRRRGQLIVKSNLGSYLTAAIKYQMMNRLVQRYTKRHHSEAPFAELGYESADSSLLEQELPVLIDDTVSNYLKNVR